MPVRGEGKDMRYRNIQMYSTARGFCAWPSDRINVFPTEVKNTQTNPKDKESGLGVEPAVVVFQPSKTKLEGITRKSDR